MQHNWYLRPNAVEYSTVKPPVVTVLSVVKSIRSVLEYEIWYFGNLCPHFTNLPLLRSSRCLITTLSHKQPVHGWTSNLVNFITSLWNRHVKVKNAASNIQLHSLHTHSNRLWFTYSFTQFTLTNSFTQSRIHSFIYFIHSPSDLLIHLLRFYVFVIISGGLSCKIIYLSNWCNKHPRTANVVLVL